MSPARPLADGKYRVLKVGFSAPLVVEQGRVALLGTDFRLRRLVNLAAGAFADYARNRGWMLEARP